HRYVMAKLSWDKVAAPSTIVDMDMSDEELYFLTADGAYQYTTPFPNATPPDTGTFDCEAWTDIDNDDIEAHWVKRGTYRVATSSWQGGHVWADNTVDDW
ncbi:MAG TPA: hypothetical protein P5076_06820, partial [Myxococcota bacterium]|nr:hypothetical protein [Myxococcota bacterium]